VFRATDLETSEKVAVKVVRAPGAPIEVANARSVRHPNVCRVFHVEHHGDLRVIVMELLEGPTLEEALPRLTPPERLTAFHAICAGVAAAHAAGVLHLDLKPRNVVLAPSGPVVCDFGLSARTDEKGTGQATGGTPAYMAPEQRCGGPVGARTDVYALGRVLEDLVGSRSGYQSVIRRATARDSTARFADARALAGAVTARQERTKRVAQAGVAVTVLLAALVVVAFVLPRPAGRRAFYDPALWGPDLVPASAWNIAPDAQLSASHPGTACGQSLSDLVDGQTQYQSWQRGFAFPFRPPGHCIGLNLLGTCGERRADAQACEIITSGGDGSASMERPLPVKMAELDASNPAPGQRFGQWSTGVPCGERWLELDFGHPFHIRAVRLWFHGPEHVPSSFRVLYAVGDEWLPAYQTSNWIPADFATQPAWHSQGSGPVTADFPPFDSDRVRLSFDSCTVHDPTLGHGWIWEAEVFADLPWYQSLWRWMFDRQ
jgi:hypothetical protein